MREEQVERTRWSGVVAGAAALALAACSEGVQMRTIERPRAVESAGMDHFAPASAEERFGFTKPSEPEAPRILFETPPGWVGLPPTSMRAVNLRVAGDERAECYLTILTGDAGGLTANVDRWRAQMSLAPSTPEELAALERCQFFGRDAVLLDVAGTWKGMNGAQNDAEWRLAGLLLVHPQGSAFLKMTGPAAIVEQELDHFRALARSSRTPEDGASASVESGGPRSVSNGLTWQAPAEWRRAPERATRTVSFFVDPHDQVECYVTVLSGAAGGALANVNRWRAQLGLAECSAADVEALPRLSMLGGEGLFVELDVAAEARDTLLFGAVCERTDASVFVKLSGPREVVASERERFQAFCQSLSLAQ